MGIIQGVDHLFTGKVERVDAELLQSLLAQGVVPVIPPLGFDGDGKTYRVNSDGVAVAVAEAAEGDQADLRHVAGRPDPPRPARSARCWSAELGRAPAAGPRGLRAPKCSSKAQHAARRLQGRRAARPRDQRHGGRRPAGRGVLQPRHRHADLRERVRAHPAGEEEGRAGHPAADQAGGRSRRTGQAQPNGAIEKNLGDYFIFEIDKNPVACVALHVYPETDKGELACLYVSASHENQGIGRKLIQFVEDRARELGLQRTAGALDAGVHVSFSPRAASSKARPTTCRPRAARNTSRAAATRRCWSRDSRRDYRDSGLEESVASVPSP